MRPLGAIAIAVIWIRLFYFLRLFSPTANMIRMIFECMYDMGSFGFVLALTMMAWANVFYILDMNSFDRQTRDGEEDPTHFIEQGNFLIAAIYSFRIGLGDFSTDYQGL